MMWGTVGTGLSSPIIGALLDWYSAGLPKKDYFPAFFICIFLMIIDIIIVSKMTFPFKKKKVNFKKLGAVLKSFTSILFLVH